MLGFAKKPAEKEIDHILAKQSGIPVEQIIKQALKSL